MPWSRPQYHGAGPLERARRRDRLRNWSCGVSEEGAFGAKMWMIWDEFGELIAAFDDFDEINEI